MNLGNFCTCMAKLSFIADLKLKTKAIIQILKPMKRKLTTKERIIKHLLQVLNLSALKGFYLYDTMRLSARIHDLRREGWPIESKLIEKGTKKFAQYSIPAEYKKNISIQLLQKYAS